MGKVIKFIARESLQFGLFVGVLVLATKGPELKRALQADKK